MTLTMSTTTTTTTIPPLTDAPATTALPLLGDTVTATAVPTHVHSSSHAPVGINHVATYYYWFVRSLALCIQRFGFLPGRAMT